MTDLDLTERLSNKEFNKFSLSVDRDLENYDRNIPNCFLSQIKRRDALKAKLDKPITNYLNNDVERKYDIIKNEKEIINKKKPKEEILDEPKYKGGFFSCIYSRYRNLITGIYKTFTKHYAKFNKREMVIIELEKFEIEKDSPEYIIKQDLDKTLIIKGTYEDLIQNKINKQLRVRILTHLNFTKTFDLFTNLSNAIPDVKPELLVSLQRSKKIKLNKEELIGHLLSLNEFIKQHDLFLIMLRHLNPSELKRVTTIEKPKYYEDLYWKVDKIFDSEPEYLFRNEKRIFIAKPGDYNSSLNHYLSLIPYITELNKHFNKTNNLKALKDLEEVYLDFQKGMNSNSNFKKY